MAVDVFWRKMGYFLEFWAPQRKRHNDTACELWRSSGDNYSGSRRSFTLEFYNFIPGMGGKGAKDRNINKIMSVSPAGVITPRP